MIKNLKNINWYEIFTALILLFGIYILTKLYFMGDMFEDDECRLALSMIDKNVWQMFLPLGAFSASPIFMFFSKIIAEISNYNEHALKFIPFVVSILNLFLFFKFSESYFNKKTSVILSIFIFAINFNLLYFSSIFKQYIIEVFIAILCLKFLPKIDILNLNKKQFIIFSLIIAILPLVSITSLFFIFVFFIINICQNIKVKDFYKKFIVFAIPFLFIFCLYYFINLLPSKTLQFQHYAKFWNEVYNVPFLPMLVSVVKFLFNPNKYTLCVLIPICFSGLYIIMQKQERTKTNVYLVSIPILSFLLSALNVYPLTIGRTAIYLIPILVLLLIKVFDISGLNKFLHCFLIIITILGIYTYFTPDYIQKINNVRTTFRYFAPKEFMREILDKGDTKNDRIITSESSIYYATFYAFKYNYPIDNIQMIIINKNKNPKSEIYSYLNNLSADKNYWFYLIKDYARSPQRIYITEWLKSRQNIDSEKKYDSYLYYLKNINGSTQ